MEYQPESSCSIQRSLPSSCADSCAHVGTNDRPSIPEMVKPGFENGMESSDINPHGGDKGTVVPILIEMYPRCSDARVGEQAFSSKVLTARVPVLHQPHMILVGTYNENHSEKAYLVQKLHFLIDFEVVLGGDALEEEVVVHG